MHRIYIKLRKLVEAQPEAFKCLFIFAVCAFVYLLNRQTISSNDNIPQSLLAFNLFENHTLHFDALRNSHFYGVGGECLTCPDGTPYYFVEAPNGHLTSSYPVGTAVVTFPLYLIFYLYLKLQFFVQSILSGVPVDLPNINNIDFEPYRRGMEKLAGSLVTALSVVFFYLTTRLKFKPAAANLTTFIFAFSTTTWVINAQGLKQHTVANLLLTIILYCLFKANRIPPQYQRGFLFVAGLCCGLIPSVRLPCAIFSVAAVVYSVFAYRKQSIFLLLGLPTALINILWNYYYFGGGNLLGGGYSRLMQGNSGSYVFTFDYFVEAFSGLLFSPSDGFFVYSPVVLFAFFGIYKVFQWKAGNDEKLMAGFIFASLILFVNYCFFVPWNGGSGSFGSRYLTDLLPVVCLLIGYFVEFLARQVRDRSSPKQLYNSLFVVFLVTLFYSTSVQAIGAFSKTTWGTVPLPLTGANKDRLWDWNDSQIQRHASSILFKALNPVGNGRDYLRKTDGEIQQVTTWGGEPLTQLALPSQKQMSLKAILQNTGDTRWYGYQTGMTRGEVRVKIRFLNEKNQEVKTGNRNFLYVSGLPAPGSEAIAIGAVLFPKPMGHYRMIFDLVVTNVGEFPGNTLQPDYEIPVEITTSHKKRGEAAPVG